MLTQAQKDKIILNIIHVTKLIPNSKRTNTFIVNALEEGESHLFPGYTPENANELLEIIAKYARDGKGVVFGLKQLQDAGLRRFDVQVVIYQPKRSNYPKARINVIVDWNSFNDIDYLHMCRPLLVTQ